MRIKKSIKTKLLVIISLLVAVPLIVSLIISSVNISAAGVQNAIEMNDAHSIFVEQILQNVIEKNIKALNAFASSPFTHDYITGNRTEEHTQRLVKQLKLINSDIDNVTGNSIAVSGADGMQLVRTNGKCVNVGKRDYFKEAMKGKNFVSDIIVSTSSGTRIAVFSVPIYDESGIKVIGIVQRNFDLEGFHDILASLINQDRQEIVILDNNGNVIAHSGHKISVEKNESQAEQPYFKASRGSKFEGKYETEFNNENWYVSW